MCSPGSQHKPSEGKIPNYLDGCPELWGGDTDLTTASHTGWIVGTSFKVMEGKKVQFRVIFTNTKVMFFKTKTALFSIYFDQEVDIPSQFSQKRKEIS